MCFDEFHVSDIADAMILGRLMDALFERGVVFCDDLQLSARRPLPNGLQRHNFLPTIELMKERFDVLEVDGGIDYRLRTLEKVEVYHVPPTPRARRKMEAAFREISGGEGHQRPVNILERELPVSAAPSASSGSTSPPCAWGRARRTTTSRSPAATTR
jgi:cell division protein ZapE